LLWRLSLLGVDLGTRPRALSSDVETLVDDPVYVFNDWHAVMAFGLAGRHDLVEQLVFENRTAAKGTNGVVVERCGLSLLEGFGWFAAGRFDRALEALASARDRGRAVGGSNAQRDVIDLTMIAAAARSGNGAAARRLVAQRAVRKPSGWRAAKQLLDLNRPIGGESGTAGAAEG
jgi:hypothetical protein